MLLCIWMVPRTHQSADVINRMVLRFMSGSPSSRLPPGSTLGLHPLDVRRRSMLYGPKQPPQVLSRDIAPDTTDIIRSAVELYEAGIRFRKTNSDSLHNIRFRGGVLSMPAVSVDDSTEYMFLNLMAFERLHVGAGNDVTAYIFFMDNIIDSAKDVALLSTSGIIQNAIGSDKAVAQLFNSISKDVVLEPHSSLDAVQREVNAYCGKPWNLWRANLVMNGEQGEKNRESGRGTWATTGCRRAQDLPAASATTGRPRARALPPR